MKKQTVTVVVNNPHLAKTLGVKAGGEVKVEVKNGVPVIREWRNRFKDMAIDGCISIVQNAKVDKPTKKGDDE